MPIEFLDSEQPDPVEPDVAHPAARRGVLLRVLAGVAVVAAVIAWALTRPDGGGTAGAPRPSATGSAPPTKALLSPATVRCGTGGPVTTELASAMQHFLPKLKIANLRVYRCLQGSGPDGRIIFEAVTGEYPGQHIDVEASVRGVGDSIESPHLGATSPRYVMYARIDTIAAGLRVSVVDWVPRGTHPRMPGDQMSELADFVSLNIVL